MRWQVIASRAKDYVLPLLLWEALFAADHLSGFACGRIEINRNGYLMYCFNTALWTGLLATPALMLGRRARWFYAPVYVVCALTCAIQWYARTHFDLLLDGSVVGIVLASSPEELRTFFGELVRPGVLLGAAAALLFAAFAARVFWRMRAVPVRRAGFVLSFLAIAAFVSWHRGVWRSPGSLLALRPMTGAWYSIAKQRGVYERYHALRTRPSLPAGVRLDVADGDAPFMVFVLGESATRNRWGAYGYERATTPRIDAVRDETVVFSDVVGAAHYTAGAMRLLLTEADLERPWNMNFTLPQLLRQCGCRSWMVSAQRRWDNYGCSDDCLFAGCDRQVFLGEEQLPEPWYDDALLPYLDEAIAANAGVCTAVFLHLAGSHQPARKNYPPAKARFAPEVYPHGSGIMSPLKNRNHYDNTIAFTDEILGAVIERLRRLERSTLMFYVPDHGESVDSRHWRNLADRSVWELPMVCWLSPRYRANYPATVRELEAARDRPLQTDRLLTGLASLFRVAGYGRPEDDFHSPRFVARARLIRDGKEEYAK